MKNKVIMFISLLAIALVETYFTCKDASVVNIVFLSITALALVLVIIDIALCTYRKKKGINVEREEVHLEFDKVKKWLWIPLVLFCGVVGLVIYLAMYIGNKKKSYKID